MAATVRGRPAHAPGPTYFSYAPNGKFLVTVGQNGAIRLYNNDADDEPTIIDASSDSNLAVVAKNDFCVVGGEDGSVSKYSFLTRSFEGFLARCTAPVRDLALSQDGLWCAIASDELEVKVVNTQDMQQVLYLREQSRPVKNVSFDMSGTVVTVSCSDGLVYVYSLSSEKPKLLKRIDGLIKALEPESDASAKATWHPDGRAFGAPTSTKDFRVVSRNDWQHHTVFSGGHRGDIAAAAWSPNGALLATAGADKVVALWETRTQKLLQSLEEARHPILSMHWHPTENKLVYTNSNGELCICDSFVPAEYAKLLKVTLHAAPLNSEPLSDISGNVRRPLANGDKLAEDRGTENEYVDDLLDAAISDVRSEASLDFIEDDDGGGYAEEPNRHGKRAAYGLEGPRPKRPISAPVWQPHVHEAFQSGSTPWKGNRRYLCLNLIGFVWTVNQDTHNSVTVEFYDRQEHRDFHFTDAYMYDKACLNDNGALFACKATNEHPAVIYYRPHETWTARTDWRTHLPSGEEATSISLSQSCVVATTTAGYVRIYSLFGVPLKVYRQKNTPAVTCASWRDYVMTVGNGPVAGNGMTRLVYTIENVVRDEICQSEDVIALPDGVELKSVFFSDRGDPCIYDSEGVLLILLHWRIPGQAKWVPLLDTKTLDRLAGGKKEESYWPVAVANDKFHCIILKGGEEYPYFPRPLLSDFEFRIPITNVDTEEEDQDAAHQQSLEEQFVRRNVQHALIQDLVENTNATQSQRAEVAVTEREVDKVLLQLLASECRQGEERGMKALEIVKLMKDRSGKMLEAAGKVAARFQRDILSEKIMQLAERRLVGLVDDDEV